MEDPGILDVLRPLDLSEESESEAAGKDGSENALQHQRLLKDISALSGHQKKREKKSVRSEPSKELSEANWVSGKDGNKKLQLQDVIGSLDASSAPIARIKKKLNQVERTTTVLNVPLHKPQAERIERTVAYKETAKLISKWAPIVQKNRDAEQLVFPLHSYEPPPVTTTSMARSFKPVNDLEREIAAVLKGSTAILERHNKELTLAEEEALKSFDLEEAMQRRKELQKLRALQSYYEAKCRRVRKIKSKKYHRVLKKEEKKALSQINLDVLAKENPQLFKSELLKAEKMRALERASLRHRNTSKWAKNLITRGHKSQVDQEQLREQLRVSRQMTEHMAQDENSADEEAGAEGSKEEEGASTGKLLLLNKSGHDPSNPWLLGAQDLENKKALETAAAVHLKKLKPIQNQALLNEHTENATPSSDEERHDSGDEWDNDHIRAAQPGDDNIRAAQAGDDNIRAAQVGDYNIPAAQADDDNIRAAQADDESKVDSGLKSSERVDKKNEAMKSIAKLKDSAAPKVLGEESIEGEFDRGASVDFSVQIADEVENSAPAEPRLPEAESSIDPASKRTEESKREVNASRLQSKPREKPQYDKSIGPASKRTEESKQRPNARKQQSKPRDKPQTGKSIDPASKRTEESKQKPNVRKQQPKLREKPQADKSIDPASERTEESKQETNTPKQQSQSRDKPQADETIEPASKKTEKSKQKPNARKQQSKPRDKPQADKSIGPESEGTEERKQNADTHKQQSQPREEPQADKSINPASDKQKPNASKQQSRPREKPQVDKPIGPVSKGTEEYKQIPNARKQQPKPREKPQAEKSIAPANMRTEEYKQKANASKQQSKPREDPQADKEHRIAAIEKLDERVIELDIGSTREDDDESLQGDVDQLMNIREAFANDNVIGDFVQEKEDHIQSSKSKAVDLTLPGWGEWGGAGLKISARKQDRFVEEPKPAKPRKDHKIVNVIINEERNQKLAKLQVSQVPFPYSSKVDFERSIRQPIGAQWNTPSVVKKLTEPRIVTLPGKVIEPLHAGRDQKRTWKRNQEQQRVQTKRTRKH